MAINSPNVQQSGGASGAEAMVSTMKTVNDMFAQWKTLQQNQQMLKQTENYQNAQNMWGILKGEIDKFGLAQTAMNHGQEMEYFMTLTGATQSKAHSMVLSMAQGQMTSEETGDLLRQAAGDPRFQGQFTDFFDKRISELNPFPTVTAGSSDPEPILVQAANMMMGGADDGGGSAPASTQPASTTSSAPVIEAPTTAEVAPTAAQTEAPSTAASAREPSVGEELPESYTTSGGTREDYVEDARYAQTQLDTLSSQYSEAIQDSLAAKKAYDSYDGDYESEEAAQLNQAMTTAENRANILKRRLNRQMENYKEMYGADYQPEKTEAALPADSMLLNTTSQAYTDNDLAYVEPGKEDSYELMREQIRGGNLTPGFGAEWAKVGAPMREGVQYVRELNERSEGASISPTRTTIGIKEEVRRLSAGEELSSGGQELVSKLVDKELTTYKDIRDAQILKSLQELSSMPTEMVSEYFPDVNANELKKYALQLENKRLVLSEKEMRNNAYIAVLQTFMSLAQRQTTEMSLAQPILEYSLKTRINLDKAYFNGDIDNEEYQKRLTTGGAALSEQIVSTVGPEWGLQLSKAIEGGWFKRLTNKDTPYIQYNTSFLSGGSVMGNSQQGGITTSNVVGSQSISEKYGLDE